MDLYSFIGLVIALFGGTYTGVAALNGFFGSWIDKDHAKIHSEFDHVKEREKKSPTQMREAKCGYRSAKFCYVLWNVSRVAPTLVFLGFSFFITLFCWKYWKFVAGSDNSASGPSMVPDWGRPTLLGICITFFVLAVTAMISLGVFWLARKKLRNAYHTLLETEAESKIEAHGITAQPDDADYEPPF